MCVVPIRDGMKGSEQIGKAEPGSLRIGKIFEDWPAGGAVGAEPGRVGGRILSGVATRKPCGVKYPPGNPPRWSGHCSGSPGQSSKILTIRKDPGGDLTICSEPKIRNGLAFQCGFRAGERRIGQSEQI